MLGLKRLEADFTYAAAPTPNFLPAVDAVTGEGLLELGFQVEEAEMLVDLEARLLLDVNVDDTVNLTLLVHGQDVEQVGAAGLWQVSLLAAGTGTMVHFTKTLRLDQGYSTVALAMLATPSTPIILGSVIPAELSARRHSHPATLGHGVDSKVQLVQ